jgi:signal transduction histidine kinase
VLHELLSARRDQVLRELAERPVAPLLDALYDQVVAILRKEAGLPGNGINLNELSDRLGRARGRNRAPIRDVIHDFGAICTAIMDVARGEEAQISPREYQVLNQALDEGMAQAVTAYTANRDTDRDQDAAEQLGMVTHELRNALHAATVSFAAIRSGKVPTGGRTADLVERSHRRLRGLVARFVAVVRMRAEIPARRDPVDLGAIVVEALDMIELDARDKGLTVSAAVDILGAIPGDGDMVFSAISNIFQNAVKHSAPNGTIAISARATAKEAIIDVQDSCGGLPPGAEASMFAPFRQMGRDRSGLGLGLAMAHQIVVGHGGAISVENLPGKGCVFTIVLPKP